MVGRYLRKDLLRDTSSWSKRQRKGRRLFTFSVCVFGFAIRVSERAKSRGEEEGWEGQDPWKWKCHLQSLPPL